MSNLRDVWLQYAILMRLHQPAGIWLLLWPCWWSATLAGSKDWRLYLLFALGAVCMRAAGCIINDLMDRSLDAQVARTQSRPLAAGTITVSQAGVLLVALCAVAAMVAWMLGRAVFFWSIAALPLVLLYPLMKRITWWPQCFLGLTFNWGALVGWVAVHGDVSTSAVVLYLASMCWTVGYDTIYAHQDKEDDARIGVKSTARRVGRYTKPFVAGCYLLFALGCWWVIQPHDWAWWPMVCACFHLLWQVVMVRLDWPSSCKKIFTSNVMFGWLIWAAIWLSGL